MTTHTHPDPDESFFERVADLPLTIDGYDRDITERTIASGDSRVTTIISIHGDGATGAGEDVTYDTDAHHALDEDVLMLPASGEYTLASFSEALDGIELFPGRDPHKAFHHYRRWGFESAALDVALRQANTTLAEAFDRTYDPVRFVVSNRLGDPPTFERIGTWIDINPDLEFKLDPTVEWSPTLIDDLTATDAVRILDLKGQYDEGPVAQSPDPDLYKRVREAFPDALIEDPALTKRTMPLFSGSKSALHGTLQSPAWRASKNYHSNHAG